MLREWIESADAVEFLTTHFQRTPCARPGSAGEAVGLLTWDTLKALVETEPRPDTLVVRDGRLLPAVLPTTIDDVKHLFSAGCSVVLRSCEGHDPGLAALAGRFAEELAGDVSVQVYATPREHFSFGWHYDCEDVFIAQTAGEKEYLLRENTLNPEPVLGAMPRDMQYERETSDTRLAVTLVPGDFLYIPRGWWHVAHAARPSLSISVGVLSAAARGSAATPPFPAVSARPWGR